MTKSINLEILSDEQLKNLYAEYEAMLYEDDATGYLTDAEYKDICHKLTAIEKIFLNRKIKQLEKEKDEEIKEMIRLRQKSGGVATTSSIRHKNKDDDGISL